MFTFKIFFCKIHVYRELKRVAGFMGVKSVPSEIRTSFLEVHVLRRIVQDPGISVSRTAAAEGHC
jgi:hypothetical protein